MRYVLLANIDRRYTPPRTTEGTQLQLAQLPSSRTHSTIFFVIMVISYCWGTTVDSTINFGDGRASTSFMWAKTIYEYEYEYEYINSLPFEMSYTSSSEGLRTVPPVPPMCLFMTQEPRVTKNTTIADIVDCTYTITRYCQEKNS